MELMEGPHAVIGRNQELLKRCSGYIDRELYNLSSVEAFARNESGPASQGFDDPDHDLAHK
jgi:hypothetical protein